MVAWKSVLLLSMCMVATVLSQPLNTVNDIEFNTLDEATRRRNVKYTGFVFDFFTGNKAEVSANGFQVPANVDTDAFTQTLGEFGNSLNLLNLGGCAGNTPHVHPRAAEISTIVRGTIQFGFVEENAGQNRLVVVDAKAGQVVFIPQGLMHFSHNQDCTPAAFVANFGNRDPGTQTIWASLMAIPTPILAASINIEDSQELSELTINKWKKRQLVGAPATGGAECLKRCKLSYKNSNLFMASPADRAASSTLGPIVPTDQLGNPQSFKAGGVEADSNRCDFLGITNLPAEPTPATCPAVIPQTKSSAPEIQYAPTDSTGNWGRRLLQLQRSLPQDRITVMDAADLEKLE